MCCTHSCGGTATNACACQREGEHNLLRNAQSAGRRNSASSTRQAQRPRRTASLAHTDSEAQGCFTAAGVAAARTA
jgi:hypothetical protein